MDVLALFEQLISSYEGDAGGVAGEADDVEGFFFADACGFEFASGGGGEGFDGVEAHFFQFLAGGWSDAWKVF